MSDTPSSTVDWQAELARLQSEWHAAQPQMQQLQTTALAHDFASDQATGDMAHLAFENQPQALWSQSEGSGIGSVLAAAKDKALDYLEIDSEVKKHTGFDFKGLGHHVLDEAGEFAAEQLTHLARKHDMPPPVPKAATPWFYVVEEEPRGPVTEDELVAMLGDGTLPRSTLVWNKTMSEWKPAAQTPLAVHLEAVPPPVPFSKPVAVKKKGKSVCPHCGEKVAAADRFCGGCGKPLKS